LLSKDNKVFLASQERFELPTRQLPIYKRFFHRLLNVHLCGQLTIFVKKYYTLYSSSTPILNAFLFYRFPIENSDVFR